MDGAPLQIDCTITRIATVAAGGWSLTVHVPEVFAPQVKPLIGHENKTQFVLMLVEAGKVEQQETTGTKKGGGRCPKPQPIPQP